MKPQRMQLMAYFIIWALSFVVQSAHSDPKVPCFFVFGDSLSDNGNNNGLQTDAKVNYSPYGIDFPGQIPTGRFSNGRNVVDVIAEHLGFEESVPSYASTAEMDQDILFKGVNYASGSAGILQETGQHLGVRIPLNEQLQNHGTVVSKISSRLGNGSSSYLKTCLYMINIGSNDYFNNYYMPDHYLTSHSYSRHQYAQVLIQQYSQQVQTLYEMGARKVAMFGLGELGCVPQAISKYGALKKLCYNHMNIASVFFNNRLRKCYNGIENNKDKEQHTDLRGSPNWLRPRAEGDRISIRDRVTGYNDSETLVLLVEVCDLSSDLSHQNKSPP